jgi:predicted DNA-binding transcriptional regulator YafY
MLDPGGGSMRADRLLSLLMLLQTRGRMTAQALAGELEISVRTVYRDIEALSSAGVPIYAERGPGGGCALLDHYRTELTGLREDEVRALFMASTPAALADLGFAAELKAALLKLLAALPAERRSADEWVRQRILLDWEAWRHGASTAGAAPHLRVIQQAIWNDRRITIRYRRQSSFYRHDFERLVDPYALVAKTGNWYLVYAAVDAIATEYAKVGAGNASVVPETNFKAGQYAGLRVHKVAELTDVEAGGEQFVRPPDFDLEAFWRFWCDRAAEVSGRFAVQVRVAAQLLPDLPHYLGEQAHLWELTASSGENWLLGTLYFDRFEEARTKLLGLGAGVEIVTPEALRRSLLDYAQQVVMLYTRH